MRVATSGLGLSRTMEERLRQAVQDRRAQAMPDAARRQLSRDEELERRMLDPGRGAARRGARYLAQVPAEA